MCSLEEISKGSEPWFWNFEMFFVYFLGHMGLAEYNLFSYHLSGYVSFMYVGDSTQFLAFPAHIRR